MKYTDNAGTDQPALLQSDQVLQCPLKLSMDTNAFADKQKIA